MFTLNRRVALLSLGAAAALALTGCAALNTVTADAQTFGSWPAGRTESADAKAADVVVSLGARVSRSGPAPWDDPLWWRWNGSYWGWRYGPAWRPYYSRWGYSYPMDPMMERRYDREVAMLLRDRKTNEPLYEARASNDGLTEGGKELFGALFEASLADFPQTRPEPHRVSVPLTPSR